MLRVELTSREGDMQSLPFDRDEVTIGRDPTSDLVLPRGNISKRHARIVKRDDKAILVDLRSTNGTWVNGRRLASPLVVRETDRIVIGDFVLRVSPTDFDEHEPTLELHVTEQRLLAALAAGEPGSREVYADWLEERGEAARPEFLRLQDTLAALPPGPHEHEARSRVRALAPGIDARWRLKVVRPVVENCGACSRDWGTFQPTRSPDVRSCAACRCLVYYCRSFHEASMHAQLGPRVVIDPSAARSPDEPALHREDAPSPYVDTRTAEIPIPPGS